LTGSSGPESTNQEEHYQTKPTLTEQTFTEQPQPNYAFDYVEPAWLQTGSGGPLPEPDCGPSSGPRSSHVTPAGQVDGVFMEDWSSTTQFDLESDRLDQLLQNDSLYQETQGIAEASDMATTQIAAIFECTECFETFSKRHLLNKHMKKHFPPFQCDECDRAFQYRKDLKRHRQSQHPETVEEPTMPRFCSYPGCKFSAERSTGYTRKDNLNRHIQTQHPGWLFTVN